MYLYRQVSPLLRKLLPYFSVTLYHVLQRWQHQLPLKSKILVSCRKVANDSRLQGCDTAVIGSVVNSVSKVRSVFIYNVRQFLNPQARGSFEALGTTQPTMAEYPTR
jgi:hypothetical protein